MTDRALTVPNVIVGGLAALGISALSSCGEPTKVEPRDAVARVSSAGYGLTKVCDGDVMLYLYKTGYGAGVSAVDNHPECAK